MKLEPAWIIPDQKRSTTPDMFISEQYGRLPGPNDDGPFYLDTEVRLSRIVDGLTPAFKENNSIIYGLSVDQRPDRTYLKGNDLFFKIDEGTGIINSRVFKIPNHINGTWPNFAKDIPSSLPKGKILIYLAHAEAYVNHPERPYQRSTPPRDANETLPHDQSTFNPIVVCGAWYDPVTQQVTYNSSWNYYDHKIILAGNLWYEKNFKTGVTTLIWDNDDVDDIVIKTSNGEEVISQSGGSKLLEEVDGGPLEEVDVTTKPNAIAPFLDTMTSKFGETFLLPTRITNINSTYCFYNGVLYQPIIDYVINSSTNELSFLGGVIGPNKRLLFYQNTSVNPNGYFELLSDGNITVSGSTQPVSGLNPGDRCLVHINGLLVRSTEYAITTNNIVFTTRLNAGDWMRVTRLVPGKSGTSYVELVYCGLASNGTTMTVYGLNNLRRYMIFYNGILYDGADDYEIAVNTLIFKSIIMDASNEIVIVGI